MKKFKLLLTLFVSISLVFTACKKEDEDDTDPNITYDTSERGSNDETARDEYDHTIDDIFKSLENTGISTGRTSGSKGVILPCGVVKIDSTGGVYRFKYDSTTNCNKRVLSGTVSAALVSGSKWEDVGAKMNLTFTNYRIFFSANNQTLTFNGVLTVTNRDGGKLWHVLNAGGNKTIVHLVGGSIQITFDNNKNDTRTWVITKKKTFESSNGLFSGVTWKLEADGSVAETGTAKDGSPFTTTYPSALIWENCSPSSGTGLEGPFILTKGELVYTAGLNSMTAEPGFKYDTATKKMNKAGDCSSEGYRLTWNINGNKSTKFQYY